MADKVHIPREAPGPASEPSGGGGAAQFGLTAAMALIVGSIIGVGVFNLPTSLAAYGPITLVSMALTTVGALALAMLFVALAFISVVGLFSIKSANFTPWNVSGESAINAIGGGMAIALFSYLGVETASVAAAKVRNPDRNIPRSTILGTVATAVVYLLSLTVIFGIIPTSQLAKANAPFSDAANAIFGGTWAGNVMALAVIISGFGALTAGP